MSVIELKERLDKMSDSQVLNICKKMKINGGRNKNKKIKSLLPLISSYSFGDNDNIMVIFREKVFPEYDVQVIVKDIPTYDMIAFEYNACRDTFFEILTEIENIRDTEIVFSKIIEHRKEFCKKFSEHVNSITKACKTIQTPKRVIKILPNPNTCERLR